VPSGTRTAVCLIAAFALLAVYRLSRPLCGELGAATVTLLTALYPIWFAQSTLAHADIFAAAFTLWGITLYLEHNDTPRMPAAPLFAMALFFWLSVLSKETALATPLLLALLELARTRRHALRAKVLLALVSSVIPLAAWFAYHRHVTGFYLGNPEYLRYNATANFSAQRIAFAIFHRAIHLTAHMNLFVPVLCALACLFLPPLPHRRRLPRNVLITFAVLLAGYWIFFSVFGGALLTRYLLPAYPLVLVLCVAVWQRRLREWWLLAALSAAAFIAGLFINPPYRFAPEDNLAYRDMIVLQQQATAVIVQRWPQATVLTAFPVSDELRKPELGYVRSPLQVLPIDNFSLPQMRLAAAEESSFDTALIFSTKYDPPSVRNRGAATETRYFDFHRDLSPAEAAAILHATIVWQAQRNGQWAAVLRLDRGSLAQSLPHPASVPPL
jgi:4-amino-4-deoxy-L-arabinose transferase-like glycosyltransferase